MIRLGHNIDCSLISAFGWSDTDVCFVGNENSSGKAFLMIVDTIENKEKNINIEYMEGPTDRDILITEVYVPDISKRMLLLARTSKMGDFLDLYNVDKNNLCFSIKIDEDDSEGNVKLEFSPDGTYFLKYADYYQEQSDQKGEFVFKQCTILSLKTSQLYLMAESGLVDTYGESVCKDVIEMLNY
jgi:hypothetical protein